MRNKQIDLADGDFPTKLSQPALRALMGAGYTQLEQLCDIREADLKKLHGMGPKGIDMLRDALGAKELSFAKE